MTDQPYDPAEPTPDAAVPPPVPPGPPATAPPAAPPAVPPTEPQAPPVAPQGQPPAPYGAAPTPPPAAQQAYPPNPVAAQQGYYPPAAANPYGGYSQAPAYGGGPAYPGSLAYVEQNFGKVADFGQRALAYLIDVALTLIGLVPMVIGIIVLTVGASNTITTDQFGNTTTTGDFDPTLAVVGGLLIALGAIVSLVITIWNRIFKMGRTGQSVGKKVIGLYLLDDKTGQPIGAGMCFLRELVQSLVNQIFYLGWLWMLWDTDKQTLGDKSVHSSVVVVPKA